MARRSSSETPKDKPSPRFHGRVENTGRACDHAGCAEAGEFRAPPAEGTRSGDGPGQFRWFCLEHVRAFNSRYNFFDGMSADEIHRAQRPYAGWERETRAFAQNGTDPGRAGPISPIRSTPSRHAIAASRAGTFGRQAAIGAGPRKPEGAGAGSECRSRCAPAAVQRAGAALSPRPQWRRPEP